jgi:hypothetical protein
MSPPSIAKDKLVGKHIASIRASKDADALRVDIAFQEGGALTVRLSRPGDWGWSRMLARRPHEVCMRWNGPEGLFFVCHNDSAEESRLSHVWTTRRFDDMRSEDGQWRLVLNDGIWTPSIEWITAPAIDDNVPTSVQLEYAE